MRACISALLLVATLSLPATALAQSPVVPAIPLRQSVWVTTNDGFEVQGAVVAVTAEAIELATRAGMKRVAMHDVHVIEKKDSNKNGFWIGFMVGAAPTIGMGGPRVLTHPVGIAFVAAGGLGSGAIGWLIDNANEGRDELYRQDAGRVAVSLAPIVGFGAQKRLGVGGSVTWR